jgi:hypothetical protein
MGEAFAFPYLWVQVRYDPAVRSLADLAPFIERFRLATVSRSESRDPFPVVCSGRHAEPDVAPARTEHDR